MDEKRSAGIYIYPESESYISPAEKLASSLSIPLSDRFDGSISPVALCLGNAGLSLTDGKMYMAGDYSVWKRRIRTSSLSSEMLIRAVRIKGKERLHIIDATAGLGDDSFLLAAFGHNVDLYEKNDIIYALLEDTVKRAVENEDLSDIAERMNIHREDATKALRCLDHPIDVVYLDPMFPERDKSGKIKKKFQLMHMIESPETDERSLFDAALSASPRKIVVKRPKNAPPLCGKKPGYSISGPVIRYDVYQENEGI